MMFMNLSDIATLNIHSADYRCITSGSSKSEVINLMQNIDLSEKKVEHLKHKFLLSHMKMGKKRFNFGDIQIEIHKLYCYKRPIFWKM